MTRYLAVLVFSACAFYGAMLHAGLTALAESTDITEETVTAHVRATDGAADHDEADPAGPLAVPEVVTDAVDVWARVAEDPSVVVDAARYYGQPLRHALVGQVRG